LHTGRPREGRYAGLDMAGVHALLNYGCMAMTVWMEISRGINFDIQECYKAKGFGSLFLRLIVP